jgi:hypothetical protein
MGKVTFLGPPLRYSGWQVPGSIPVVSNNPEKKYKNDGLAVK